MHTWRKRMNETLIIKNLLEKIDTLEGQLEEKDMIIELMEHDHQQLIATINNICRETVI